MMSKTKIQSPESLERLRNYYRGAIARFDTFVRANPAYAGVEKLENARHLWIIQAQLLDWALGEADLVNPELKPVDLDTFLAEGETSLQALAQFSRLQP
jgi:hypothetical protein